MRGKKSIGGRVRWTRIPGGETDQSRRATSLQRGQRLEGSPSPSDFSCFLLPRQIIVTCWIRVAVDSVFVIVDLLCQVWIWVLWFSLRSFFRSFSLFAFCFTHASAAPWWLTVNGMRLVFFISVFSFFFFAPMRRRITASCERWRRGCVARAVCGARVGRASQSASKIAARPKVPNPNPIWVFFLIKKKRENRRC